MTDTQTFIAVVGTMLLLTILLLSIAWIPWSIAALLFRSSLVPYHLRQPVFYVAFLLSMIGLLLMLNQPSTEPLPLSPPLANIVDQALSDPSLAALSSRGLSILRGTILAECVFALLLPVNLIFSSLLACFYQLLIAPVVRLLILLGNYLLSWHMNRSTTPTAPSYTQIIQQRTQQAQQEHEAELQAIDSLPIEQLEKDAATNASKRKLLRHLKRYVSPDDQSLSSGN